jgi:dTDP-4-amino-4,6-dideoxygalactose transaminase
MKNQTTAFPNSRRSRSGISATTELLEQVSTRASSPVSKTHAKASSRSSFIPFNRPYLTGGELLNIKAAYESGSLAGRGAFSRRCEEKIANDVGARQALLTHSCTAALEMIAILLDLKEGDEVIMPSFTFVSTANAFVLRGAVPVFVDIREDTQNIDENLIENAITPRTKAIVVVHYAGVPCEMNKISAIAAKHNLYLIEDAAQAIMSRYYGRPAGSLSDLAAFSFHETKNIISGEGGALVINNEKFCERAEIILEKGTNRSRFLRGAVDKYTWEDIGSSYVPGELTAAFLSAQLDRAERITQNRKKIWERYHRAFEDLERQGRIRRPVVPSDCIHNGHIYYLLLDDLDDRQRFISELGEMGIGCVFHYVPLHASPFGKRCGRPSGQLHNSTKSSDRLVRLPMWYGAEQQQDVIVDCVKKALSK